MKYILTIVLLFVAATSLSAQSLEDDYNSLARFDGGEKFKIGTVFTRLFSGNKASRKGLIISAVAAVLAMLLANYFSFAYDFLQELRDSGGSQTLGYALSKSFDLLRGLRVNAVCGGEIWSFTLDSSVFIKDLLISLVFAAIGAVGFFSGKLSGTKKHD